MNTQEGKIWYSAGLTTKDLQADAARARAIFNSIADDAQVQGARIDASFKKVGLGVAAYLTVQQSLSFAKSIATVRGEFQQLEVAFKTMLGSKAKADALMAQVVETAARTPFDLKGVANGAKQLLAYGFAAEDVNGTLTKLGDIASGLSIPLNDMVYLYGTTMTQGRLFTQDLRQFMGRGIPLAEELAKQFGVTKDRVSELVTAGKVGFPEVKKAIEAMTSEGGKFHNLMEEQSKTITGQISNLGDAWDGVLNDMGRSSEGAISVVIGGATYLLENYENVLSIIGDIILAYGAYKAAVITLSVIEKARLAATLSGEIALSATTHRVTALMALKYAMTLKLKAAQEVLNATMAKNPYALIAMAIAAAAFATYKIIKAVNEETEAEKALREEQERKIERNREYLSMVSKEQVEVDILFGRLKGLTKGTTAYNNVKDEILSKYGSYLKGLDSEIRALKNVEGAYKAISVAAVQSARDRALSEATSAAASEYAKIEAGVLKGVRDMLIEANGALKGEELFTSLKQSVRLGEDFSDSVKTAIGYTKEWGKETTTLYDKIVPRNPSFLEVTLTHLSSSKKKMQDDIKEVGDILGGVFTDTGVEESSQTYSEQLAKTAEEIKTIKKGIADIRSGTYQLKPGEDAAKLLEDKTKELKEAQSKYDLLTGIDSKSAAKDYSSEVVDVMLKGEQLKLDVMRDGRAKELAQIEQTKKEKLAAIDKEQKEVATKLGSQGKKLTKDDLSAFNEQRANVGLVATNDTAAVNKKYDEEIADNWKALTSVFLSEEEKRSGAIHDEYTKRRKWLDELNAGGGIDAEQYAKFTMQIDASEAKEQLDALTADYQTYADQRNKIEEKFNADIAALQAKNKDGKLDGNIAEVEKQKKAALSKVKVDEASAGLDFTKLFGNLDNLTLPAAKELRDKIKVWIDEAGNSLAPEDLKAVSDAFQKLELKIADKDPFAILKSSIADYKKSTEDVATAQTAAIASQEAYNKVLAENGKDSEAAKKAAENLTKAEKNLSEAQQKRAAAVAKANEAIGSIADKGQQIVGAAQDVLGIMSDLGVKVPENIANALGGIGQIMDGLGSIDLTQPLSIVTGAVKMLGGLVKTVASLFNGDNKREAEIERLQGKIDTLSTSYDKLQKAVEKAYSTDAGKLLDQSNELIEKQKTLIKLQITEEEGKKDTDSGKIDAWKKQIDELDQKASENVEKKVDLVLGSDWKSDVDSFVSGYMDSFGVIGQGAKEMADQMKKNIIKGLLSKDISKAVEANRERMEALLKDEDLSEADMAEIDKMSAEITKIMDQRGKMYEGLLKTEKETPNENSFTGAIRGSVATEASVAELGGIFRGQYDKLASIDSKMTMGMGAMMEMARTNAAIELNTRATAVNTAQTVTALADGFKELKGELTAIKTNTAKDTGSYGG